MGIEQLGTATSAALATTLTDEASLSAATASTGTNPSSSRFEHGSPSSHLAARIRAAELSTSVAVLTAPAVAKAAPIAETVAALSQSLPPTWAIVAGGLLYAEPAVRMTANVTRGLADWGRMFLGISRRPTPAHHDGLLGRAMDRVNEVSGRIAEHTVLARDASSVAMALHLGINIFTGGDFGGTQALETLALTASGHELFYRGNVEGQIERQMKEQGELSLDAYERTRYRSLGLTAPRVPDEFHQSDYLSDQPVPYADGVQPKRSVWYSLRTTWETIKVVAQARRVYAYVGGRWRGFQEWLNTITKKEHAPVHQDFLKTSDRLVRLWAERVMKANKTTVVYHNLDRLQTIQKDAPTVGAFFNHDSLWLNFAAVFRVMPHLRIMADAKNFWGNLPMRLLGFSWLMDAIGLPLVDRSAKKSGGSRSHIDNFVTMSGRGQGLLIYPQAGRVPRAYHDDGTLAPPGLYANLPFKKIRGDGTDDFAAYTAAGFARIAVEAADKMQKTVFIPVFTSDNGTGTHGMYFTSPKVSGNVVKPTPNLGGQTANISVAGVVPVHPGSDVDTITRQVLDAAKAEMKINEFLADTVSTWAAGRADLGTIQDHYALWSQTDDRWHVVVDRIRTIHRSVVENDESLRNNFKQRLLHLLNLPMPPEAELKALLADVSTAMKKYEYGSFT